MWGWLLQPSAKLGSVSAFGLRTDVRRGRDGIGGKWAALALLGCLGGLACGQAPNSYYAEEWNRVSRSSGDCKVIVGDVNRDGFGDVIQACNGRIETYLRHFRWRTEAPVVSSVGPNGQNLEAKAVIDWNLDGLADLVCSGDMGSGARGAVYFGDGAGGFALGQTLGVGIDPSGDVHVRDVDRNGSDDLVFVDGGSGAGLSNQLWVITPRWLLNPQVRSFSLPWPGTVQSCLVDVTGDGIDDLVSLAMGTRFYNGVFVAPGTGDSRVWGSTSVLPMPGALEFLGSYSADDIDLVVDEFDGDGVGDVVLNVRQFSPRRAGMWWMSGPLGGSSWDSVAGGGMWPAAGEPLHAVDVNLDGVLDLACTEIDSGPVGGAIHQMRMGKGDGSFRPALISRFAMSGGGVSTAYVDLDFDRDLDLMFLGNEVGSLRCRARVNSGCPGSGGSIPQLMTGVPFTGNANFRVGLRGALPWQPAVLGVSRALSPNATICDVALSLDALDLALDPWGYPGTITDANGEASIAFPIPDVFAMLGQVAYLQWGVGDPALPYGIGISEAGMVIVW